MPAISEQRLNYAHATGHVALVMICRLLPYLKTGKPVPDEFLTTMHSLLLEMEARPTEFAASDLESIAQWRKTLASEA